jgi:hypothetical protein
MLPPWVDDAWRTSQYPSSDWYVGFAMDVIRPGANLSEVQRRVEREAQNKLAEGITVRIQAISETHTRSNRVSDGQNFDETIRKNYEQMIQASTDAEVSRVEMSTFHDQANNRVYALARVKKADLAAYYVSRIEFYLQNAENDLKLARQFAESDRKRSALEKVQSAKEHLDECVKYNELLSAVDFQGDIRRLLDKRAALMREIAAFETQLQEAAPIFVTGSELLNNNRVSIVIPALQSRLSQGGCRIVADRNDAEFVLNIEVQDCQATHEGAFHYCYACVTATVVNTRTGRTDTQINFTSPKAGWTTADRACRQAFQESVTALWREITEKTEICK